MNAAGVPENPYPAKPAIVYAALDTVAVLGLVIDGVTAPFRALARVAGTTIGALVTLPFARRARRLAKDHPSSVSYFGTGA